MKKLTATTKGGVAVIVDGRKVKRIKVGTAFTWVISLTPREAAELGIVIKKGQPEALVIIDDQAGYEAAIKAAEKAKQESPEGQRAALAAAVENSYSPDNYPGSSAWAKSQKAQQALDKFDAEYPEVLAAIKAEKAEKAAARVAEINVWNI